MARSPGTSRAYKLVAELVEIGGELEMLGSKHPEDAKEIEQRCKQRRKEITTEIATAFDNQNPET